MFALLIFYLITGCLVATLNHKADKDSEFSDHFLYIFIWFFLLVAEVLKKDDNELDL